MTHPKLQRAIERLEHIAADAEPLLDMSLAKVLTDLRALAAELTAERETAQKKAALDELAALSQEFGGYAEAYGQALAELGRKE